MADLFGQRIDQSYIYVLNSTPGTNIVTNGDGTTVDWNANGIILNTGSQNIDGQKNFLTVPHISGLEILFKNNSLSGLGETTNSLITSDSVGAAIFLGDNNLLSGQYSVILAGELNELTGNNSLIGAGKQNSGEQALLSFIGAGSGNLLNNTENSAILVGKSNTVTSSNRSSILAGQLNLISGASDAGIVGGAQNQVKSLEGFVGAGNSNIVLTRAGAILGGSTNTSSGQNSVVGGGTQNLSLGSHSAILAGRDNSVNNGESSAIIGGASNSISGDNSAIGAGSGNNVTGNESTIIGGERNLIKGNASVIGGGIRNTLKGNDSVLVGGSGNVIFGDEVVLVGGKNNTASGRFVTLFAGENNNVTGIASTIVAGRENDILNSDDSSITAGNTQTITSSFRSNISAGTGQSISNATDSFIGAGKNNQLLFSNDSFIAAGKNNLIDTSDNSLIGVGNGNQIISGTGNSIISSRDSIINTNTRLGNTTAIFYDGPDDFSGIIQFGFPSNYIKFPFESARRGATSFLPLNNSQLINGIPSVYIFTEIPTPYDGPPNEINYNIVTGVAINSGLFKAPERSAVLNGIDNVVQSDISTILNGSGNLLAGANSIIAGINNKASGHNSYILGGTGNEIHLNFEGTMTTFEGSSISFSALPEDAFQNYNTIINGRNNKIGANVASDILSYGISQLQFAGTLAESKGSTIIAGEENTIDGRDGLIIGGKANSIFQLKNSLNERFNISLAFRQPSFNTLIPELSGGLNGNIQSGSFVDGSTLNINSPKSFETNSSIIGSIECSIGGGFSHIGQSLNSVIATGSNSDFAQSNGLIESTRTTKFGFFNTILNSVGATISGSHYSSIFNGLGNQIFSDVSSDVRSSNCTILNGARNKIIPTNPKIDLIGTASTGRADYSTILNGKSNIISGSIRENTIINGANNFIQGRNNLVFGRDNRIVSGGAVGDEKESSFSVVFGQDNEMTGSFYVSEAEERGNYVFGTSNKLLNCTDNYILAGMPAAFSEAQNSQLFNRMINSAVINCEDITVSGTNIGTVSDELFLANVFSGSTFSSDRSSIFSLKASNISGVLDSSISNCTNLNGKNITSSRISNTDFTTVSGIRRSNIMNSDDSNINNIDQSKIYGFNTNIYGAESSNVEGIDIFGNNNVVSGNTTRLHVYGESNRFINQDSAAGGSVDIFGSLNHLTGSGNRNLGEYTKVMGNGNSVTKASNTVIFGSSNNIISGSKSFIHGDDNFASKNNVLIIGNRGSGTFKGGCIINDKRLTAGQTSLAKGENTLFLDFENGTHLNIPLGSAANTNPSDGVKGSLLRSGEFLIIKTGDSGWGKIQISAL